MGKILHFSACRGEEYFTAPHNTSRRGGFSFIPVPSRPPGEAKLALLGPISAQAGKNSPSTLKPPQNQRFFTSRANFFSVSPRIQTCSASFFALMGTTATSQHLPTTSPKTDDTNAGGSQPQNETTDTFARTKQPNSSHFPPAKVSRVSCTPRRAPAKAPLVSSDVESGLMVRSKVLRHSCLPPFCWPW